MSPNICAVTLVMDQWMDDGDFMNFSWGIISDVDHDEEIFNLFVIF